MRPAAALAPKLALAMTIGLAYLAAPGAVRAGYIAALGFNGSDSEMGTAGVENDSFLLQQPSQNPADPTALESLKRLLQCGCVSRTSSGGGMGGSTGASPQTAGQHPGFCAAWTLQRPSQTARLVQQQLAYRAPPFACSIFHPPRA